MQRFRITLLVLVALSVAAFVLWGGSAAVSEIAAGWQRTFQNALARALRALQAGEQGAVVSVLSLCFAYGFAHAVGPGHGKFLIGGYGLGAQVGMRPLALVALAASLGQAVTAVILVAAGFAVFDLTRRQMTALADGALAVVSLSAIGLIGLWLLLRGLRKLWRTPVQTHAHSHDHDACCSHAHAPTAAQIAATTNLREVAALIATVAIRPCTGALFLLVIAWYLDLVWVGIAGAFAMALGTAAVTIAVAMGTVWFRATALRLAENGTRAGLVIAGLEVLAGAAITVIATSLLLRLI